MALHGYSKAWGSFRLKGFLNVIWFKSRWIWSESSKFYCRWAVRVGLLPKKLQCILLYPSSLWKLGIYIPFLMTLQHQLWSSQCHGEGRWGTLFLVDTFPLFSSFILGTLVEAEWAFHGGTTVLIFWAPQAHIAWMCGEIAVLNCTCT